MYLEHVYLPEFHRHKSIDTIKAHVFDASCNYDIILGRDILSHFQIDIQYSDNTITWEDQDIAMKPHDFFANHVNTASCLIDFMDIEDEEHESFLKEILPSKYGKVDTNMVAEQQKHLDETKQNDLKQLLSKFPTLFNGELGQYTKKKIHLTMEEGSVPFHAKAYPVPIVHHKIFYEELQRLVAVGVLERCGQSEWASPTFIIPKKDGRVRWVSDFRKVNKKLKRRIYPIPKIQDILSRRKGYKFFTKIDISMQYHTFELDDESKELCTIVTPFGKYRYKRLPMGIKESPDIAQEIMETTLNDLREFLEIYIDDIGVFSNSWEEHVSHLQQTLSRLEQAGFTVNPLKCEWATQETDWLGYWLTPNGLKPWNKKVKAILAIKPPKNKKQLRSFIGAITFYRNMWPHRSHILAPLTAMTGNNTSFKWKEIHQKAFDQIKAIISKSTLLLYPNHNLPFDIYTDASDFQLGGAIFQNGKPVAFFSKKLSKAQMNYTTTE